MKNPIKSSCPNCGGTVFGNLEKEGVTPIAILTAGIENEDGTYKLDQSKSIGVKPYVCANCNYALLFVIR